MAFWFKTIFLEYYINNTLIKKEKEKKRVKNTFLYLNF